MNRINIYVLVLIVLIVSFLKPYKINAQGNYILNPKDMSDYELVKQSDWSWSGDNGVKYDAIRQRWKIKGTEYYIYIIYCEFISEPEAIKVTSYHAGSFASRYIWGNFNGSIIADRSWIGEVSAIIFMRGNVGIQLFKPIRELTKEDREAYLTITNKILTKIEANLSQEILTEEENAKKKQVSINDYERMTTEVINMEAMKEFSPYTTWDSKWLSDTTNLVIGRRTEWIDDQKTVLGIDICQFETAEQAKNAALIQSQQSYNPIFNMDNLDSLESIIKEWNDRRKYYFDENLFSIVTQKSNLAVHIYQFDTTKINTDFTYSIIEKLAEQISNF